MNKGDKSNAFFNQKVTFRINRDHDRLGLRRWRWRQLASPCSSATAVDDPIINLRVEFKQQLIKQLQQQFEHKYDFLHL